MEAILIRLTPELIILAGLILILLAGWAIALLKRKVRLEAGLTALDTIDSIISAVVGNLTQTVAEGMKAKDGHLLKADKAKLKRKAIEEVTILISLEMTKAAQKAVNSIDSYISKRIEERVLAGK